MAQACAEISLTSLHFTGIEEAFGQIPDFKIPEMPVIPELWFDQMDPLDAKKEKLSSIVLSAIMKYVKLFVIDPIEQIVGLFMNIIGVLSSLWDEVINFTIPNLGVKFMDLLTDLAARADQAIKEIVDKIVKIVDMIKPIQIPDPITIDAKNPYWEAVQKVQAAIKEATLILIKKCMDIMKLVVDKVKLAFDLIGLSLGPLIDAFFEMLANIPDLVDQGITALMGMFNAAIDGVVSRAEALTDSVVKAAMAKWESAKAMMQEFIKKITSVFGIPIPGVPNVELTLSTMASNFWKEFVVLMQNWWSSFTTAVLNIFTKAMEEFLSLVNQFLDYVNSLAEIPKNALINAVNAITAGLFSAIANLPVQLQRLIERKITFCVDVPDVPSVPNVA